MSSEFIRKRGRPAAGDKQKIFDLLGRHIGEIFQEQSQNLVSKTHPIWTTLAQQLKPYAASSIYCYACDFKKEIQTNQDEVDAATDDLSLQSDANSTINNSSLSLDKDRHVEFSFPRSEFEAMTEMHKQKCSNRKAGFRVKRRFKPGQYSDKIFEALFDATSLPCAFKIELTYIGLYFENGYITAACKCESTLRIDFKFDDPKRVVFDCKIKLGNLKKCGKLWLRDAQRRRVAEMLQHKPVETYRAEQARKLMAPGDPEPPTLPSAKVLRQAKYERAKEEYLDADPMMALNMMAHSGYENEIPVFCLKPFFIIYWTNAQLQRYRKFCNKLGSYVSIDASGGFTKPIKKLYNRPSGPTFQYAMSMNCSDGQFAAAQMLSESHDTDKIFFFLMTQARIAGCIPKEVVSDMSRALLNAETQAYTQFNSVEDYADYLFEISGPLPATYIRLDNAHFIHLYSGLFKKRPRELRKFYLGAIGQLIMCRTKSDAKKIVKCILTLAFSEKYGKLSNGLKSKAQIAQETLEALMTENNELDQIIKKVQDTEEVNEDSNDEFQQNLQAQMEKLEESTKLTENKWSAWGAAIKEEVMNELEQEQGTQISPYHKVDLGNYLLKHLALLPIWSCIRRDDFGYGRLPATSSGSENGFKVLKTDVFPDLPYRVDRFVREHIEYMYGKMNIIEARPCTYSESETEEPAEKTFVKPIDPNSVPMLAKAATNDCPACKNKLPFPRTCASLNCKAGIHHLKECSYPLNENDDEGYQQERICRSCYLKKSVDKTSRRKIQPAGSLRNKNDSDERFDINLPKNQREFLQREASGNHQSAKLRKRRSDNPVEEQLSVSTWTRNDVSDDYDDNEADDDYYPDVKKKKRIPHKQPHFFSSTLIDHGDDDGRGDDNGHDNAGDNYYPDVKKKKRTDNRSDGHDDDSKFNDGNNNVPVAPKVQVNRFVENWKGKVGETKSNALYLGDQKELLKDAIKFGKSHKIVVLKNGNLSSTRPVTIKGEEIFVSNTCAFDSIAQLLYVSICDDANLRNKMSEYDDKFFAFLLQLYEKGLVRTKDDNTYKKRAEILLDMIGQKEREKGQTFGIQAAHNVVGFATSLTDKISAVQEIRMCSEENCKRKQVTRPLTKLQLYDTQIADPNFHNLLESPSLCSSPCQEKGCNGERTSFINATGDILLIEVVNSKDSQMVSNEVSARKIPKRILNPTGDGTELRLLGAIAYKGPARITASRQHQIAHYTAACLRNNCWYEYDDTFPDRRKNLSPGAKIVPELLIYSSIS